MSRWSRLGNVFRSGRLHRELDEELQFHIDERTRELIAAGMPPAAAAREARRRFGSPLRLREESLEVKLVPGLESLGRDIRLGLRMLWKNAGVTAAALVSLALSLGACVAAFTLVDALILRPLPVPQPERLVYVTFSNGGAERPESDTFNDPLFVRLRDASRAHVDLFAMSTQVLRPVVFGNGEKELLRTQFVSGDAFERLGVTAAVGRVLRGADDLQPGSHPVAVISHAFWLRRFGADSAILGRWFTLDDRPYQVVGVAEAEFAGVEPGRPTDVWLPYAMYNPRAFGNAQFNWFRVFGRLADSARRDETQAVLQAAFTNFRRDRAGLIDPGRSADEIARFLRAPLYLRSAANGPSPLRREFERPLWILAASAALLLLIAGSNVATLFLARTAAREREMALRLSLGAGRGRLIQQVLVESALVAAGACALGLVVAMIAAPAVVTRLAPAAERIHLDLRLDWRVMALAGGLALLTTALFGLAPALRASGIAPLAALKSSGSRSATGVAVMRPFVAIQVALGMTVLFVGSLLVLSFARVSSVDPGFATSDVLLMPLEPIARIDARQQRTAVLQVLDRLRGVPGVQAASSAEYSVLGRAWTHFVQRPGSEQAIEVTMLPVTDGFFETMRIPILAGRTFLPGDLRDQASTAIIVNEAFATRHFGQHAVVGRTIDARFGEADGAGAHEIVGVAADTRYDLRKPGAPTIYIPLRLRGTGVLHVRVAGDPAALIPRLREEVAAAAPSLRAGPVTSQAVAVGQTLIRERLLALLAGFFASIGVALAAVGLYGVLTYSVVQRTREIGIRGALGARRGRLVWTIVADAGRPVLAGVALGFAGGLYVSRFVESLLFEVTALDFPSLALPLATLLLAAILAAARPAIRAAGVDPAIALRDE